jgi:hypothetical protein
LTPSPVIATTWPRACSAWTTRSFCRGSMRAKMLTPSAAVSQRCVVEARDVGAADHPSLGRDSGGAGDGARRGRVVAGDHHDLDPGIAAFADAAARALADLVAEAEQAEEGEGQALDRLGSRRRLGDGDGEHAQSAGCERVDPRDHPRVRVRVEPAQPRDRFRRPLGGDDDASAAVPGEGNARLFRRERILAQQRFTRRVAEGLRRAIHGVPAMRMRGAQRCGGEQCEARIAARLDDGGDGIERRETLEHDAVLGDRPGLVDAQDRGGAERQDGAGLAGEYAVARQTPGADREEDREHHRQFLGHRAHRQRDAGERRFEPVVVAREVQQSEEHRQRGADKGEASGETGEGILERRARPMGAGEGGADLADPAARAGGGRFAQPLAGEYQRAGEHEGGLVAAGRRIACRERTLCAHLAHRDRLAGQRGFIDDEAGTLAHDAVRGHAVPRGEHDHVAGYDLRGGDAHRHAGADHACVRRGDAAQRRQHALAAPGLDRDEGDRDAGAACEQQALGGIADRDVEDGRADEQQEDRLLENLEEEADEAAAARRRQRVGPVGRQPPLRLVLIEAAPLHSPLRRLRVVRAHAGRVRRLTCVDGLNRRSCADNGVRFR